jgi:hypothetical protein
MNVPFDLALVIGFFGLVVGFLMAVAVLPSKQKKWSDDALCPRRSSPDPVVARWTPDHARSK